MANQYVYLPRETLIQRQEATSIRVAVGPLPVIFGNILRSLTMNRIAISLAMSGILCLSGTALGQKPQRPGGPQRPGVGGDAKAAGQGRRQPQNPQQMVARMMQQFDKDGDQKLDIRELTELLTQLRERRGGNVGAGGNQGRGGVQRQGQRPGQQRQGGARQGRKQQGDGAANPG